MIHFKRFKQARFISSRKGSDIYKIVQHFGSFFFIHSAKRISRITCRRCVHRKAESGRPAGRKISQRETRQQLTVKRYFNANSANGTNFTNLYLKFAFNESNSCTQHWPRRVCAGLLYHCQTFPRPPMLVKWQIANGKQQIIT